MSPTRRQASNTLPRNFVFHLEEDAPKTPEPQMSVASRPISPPRQQTYRVRRTRPARQMIVDPYKVPIPTIEVSNVLTTGQSVYPLLAISLPSTRVSPPPRTPSAQMIDNQNIDVGKQGESISRPSTACSTMSDSSVSSSIDSFSSLGGASFTSLESEAPERKESTSLLRINPNNLLNTPLQQHQQQPIRPKMAFTKEMDNHLWATFLRYTQDPTHTPFRMLPGTSPPCGVCARVAKDARKTWKSSRKSTRRPNTMLADSPDTIRAANSGSNTPTAEAAPKYLAPWPRSDRATRRRLIDLCKKQPEFSASRARMRTSRNPSSVFPLARPAISQDHPHDPPPFSFGTRDMNISLLASTSSAIDNLNQITEQSQSPLLPAPSGRAILHQKSHSMHVEPSSMRAYNMLASPFQPRPKITQADPQFLMPSTLEESYQPQLASPIKLHAPIPQSQLSIKRLGSIVRSGLDMEDQTLAEQPVLPGITTRRARHRGFSLNDVSQSSMRLARFANTIGPIRTSGFGSELAPAFEPVGRRLGSPFTEPRFNTFPRGGLESMMEERLEERKSD
jgi:hypothetical protein